MLLDSTPIVSEVISPYFIADKMLSVCIAELDLLRCQIGRHISQNVENMVYCNILGQPNRTLHLSHWYLYDELMKAKGPYKSGVGWWAEAWVSSCQLLFICNFGI